MPPYVSAMIVAFVGIPAALARMLAIGMAWIAGTFWFAGVPEFMDMPSALAFLIAVILGVIACLMVVVTDYVTAKHRDAVAMDTLIRCVVAEIAVQVGAIVSGSVVIAVFFTDRGEPLFMVFGPVICIGTLTFAFVHSRRIKEWKAAWSGDRGIVPPSADEL